MRQSTWVEDVAAVMQLMHEARERIADASGRRVEGEAGLTGVRSSEAVRFASAGD
jgi:hypothetical protein